MVIIEKGERQIYRFQVIHMLNPVLNITKVFREKVERNLTLTFDKNYNGSYKNIVE